MITYKVHLIRHGLTQANQKGIYAGRTDLPLCEEGRKNLLELRENCGYPQAQKVYSSPLMRCLETAEILYPDVLTEPVEDLTECDFGIFDGRPVAQLKSDPLYQQWVDAGLRTAPPGGESSEAMEERVCDGLEQVFADMMRQKISSAAVITHGGVIAALMAKYAYPKREGMYDWLVADGCGYTILMTPQMWMRDEGFEVYEPLPYRIEAYRRLGPKEFKRQLEKWRKEQEENRFE